MGTPPPTETPTATAIVGSTVGDDEGNDGVVPSDIKKKYVIKQNDL